MGRQRGAPQKKVPCIFMRGGTSRGLYFKRSDLPADQDDLSRLLIAAIGAGHPLNIDGVGGGNAVTTKVAILSKSDDKWADIDYFFAQVSVEEKQIDYAPSCGNILAGVGPAALEMRLLDFDGDTTAVKIRSANTGARVEAIIETPVIEQGRFVNYAGNARIDGVPGEAAPIILNFMDAIGSKTGHLFATGKPRQIIEGYEVSCIDVAMPMVIGRAADFGITGYEDRQTLDKNRSLFDKIEKVRLTAGQLMGLGDVSKSVVPKFGLLAAPRDGGAIAARYFMPWKTHPSYAVTGSICTGACLIVPGTIAQGLAKISDKKSTPVKIEHVSGTIDVVFDYAMDDEELILNKAGLLRTARKLFEGNIYVAGS